MARIIDITLYRSEEGPSAPFRATSLRKLYTSMLIVLLVIALGTGGYFYFSSLEQVGAVAETPPASKPAKPSKPSVGRRLAQRRAAWRKFLTKAFRLGPREIVGIGDEFIALFSCSSVDEAVAIRDSLQGICRALRIVDTATVSGAFEFVCKGRVGAAGGGPPPKSVAKYMRPAVMNAIDSLAEARGLVGIVREPVAVEQVEGGQRYTYRLKAAGRPQNVAGFMEDALSTQYALVAEGFVLHRRDTTVSAEVLWGIYTFLPKADTTGAASAGK